MAAKGVLLGLRSTRNVHFLGLRCLHTSPAAAYNWPSLPPCDFKPEEYKGKSYEDIRTIRKSFLNPGLLTYYSKPLLVHQGYKQWLFDQTNKRYLDLFAGIVTVSVGHCHPRVVEAARLQMSKLWHTTNIYLHPPIHEYAEKLVARLPGNLKVVYFTNSGSEANDMALMMARLYTGAHDIVALRNSYHGMSPVTMELTNMSSWKFQLPRLQGVQCSVNPDVYRGPWGGARCRDSVSQVNRSCNCAEGQCEASNKYADQMEDLLKHCCPKKIGAFIAEPIQGVGGAMQLPRGYLQKVYELVRQRGGVCISDEVQTGFGRLGSHFWGFEANEVVPDIVTMAKGIANGFPMAAVVTTPEIAAGMAQALHFNTYGGNPMASAVASTVLDVIDDEGLQQNCEVVGTLLLTELMKLRDRFEVIGDVRGKGLMIGMELVKNKETKEPLPAAEVTQIWDSLREHGVLVGKGGLYGTVFRIKPPMCITKEDVHYAINVMEGVFTEFENTRK